MSKKERLHRSLIDLRRSRVIEEQAQGYKVSEISQRLNVPRSTVSRDIIFVNTQAKQKVRTFVDDQLIPEFYKSLAVLDILNKRAWELLNAEPEKREQLMAIEVIKGLNRERLDILTHQDMLKSALNVSEKNNNSNSKNSKNTLSEPERRALDKEVERRYQAALKRYAPKEKQQSTRESSESNDQTE